MLPIFIDIDGTLTDTPRKPWGEPDHETITAVKKLIQRGYEVVIWSGGGTEYAKRFCQHYDIHPLATIGKPRLCYDDNPSIRPEGKIEMRSPDNLREMK